MKGENMKTTVEILDSLNNVFQNCKKELTENDNTEDYIKVRYRFSVYCPESEGHAYLHNTQIHWNQYFLNRNILPIYVSDKAVEVFVKKEDIFLTGKSFDEVLNDLSGRYHLDVPVSKGYYGPNYCFIETIEGKCCREASVYVKVSVVGPISWTLKDERYYKRRGN